MLFDRFDCILLLIFPNIYFYNMLDLDAILLIKHAIHIVHTKHM